MQQMQSSGSRWRQVAVATISSLAAVIASLGATIE